LLNPLRKQPLLLFVVREPDVDYTQISSGAGTALMRPVQVCAGSDTAPPIIVVKPGVELVEGDLWKCDWRNKDGVVVEFEPGKLVYTLHETNAAFDYCMLLETHAGNDSDGTPIAGKRHLVLVECKQTAPTTGAQIESSEMESKIKLLGEKLPQALADRAHPFRRAGIESMQQVTYVFMALRRPNSRAVPRIRGAVESNRKLSGVRVLLLDHDDLKVFYTPTLNVVWWM
jgi:hypothetical protein